VIIEAGQEYLHYRLIEKIAEGGMGVVSAAEEHAWLPPAWTPGPTSVTLLDSST
jgi:hypothetical protein